MQLTCPLLPQGRAIDLLLLYKRRIRSRRRKRARESRKATNEFVLYSNVPGSRLVLFASDRLSAISTTAMRNIHPEESHIRQNFLDNEYSGRKAIRNNDSKHAPLPCHTSRTKSMNALLDLRSPPREINRARELLLYRRTPLHSVLEISFRNTLGRNNTATHRLFSKVSTILRIRW